MHMDNPQVAAVKASESLSEAAAGKTGASPADRRRLEEVEEAGVTVFER